MLEQAKAILEILDKKGRISSQTFSLVYKEFVGKTFTFAQCATCMKTAVAELRLAVQKKSQVEKVAVVEPVKEVEKIEVKKETVKKTKKKKNG